MCRELRAAYIKNGGSDSHLLAQLAAVEKKTVAMVNSYPTGIFFDFCCTVFQKLIVSVAFVCLLFVILLHGSLCLTVTINCHISHSLTSSIELLLFSYL